MPRKPGDKRPTKRTHLHGATLLTTEVHGRFIASLRTGVPIEVAGESAGIARGTIKGWLLTGRKASAKRDRGETISAYEDACLGLTAETERVYQEVHALLAGRVVAASAKDWKAATWMLQRRHPEVWARPERIELSGPGGGPIEVAEIETRAMEYIEALPEGEPSGNGDRPLG